MFLKPPLRCQKWEELCVHPHEAPRVQKDTSFFPFPGIVAMQSGIVANVTAQPGLWWATRLRC